MLIGHVAISLLERRYLGTELGPTLVGGLFPDILDKGLYYVLRATPSGRMWGHTLLSFALSTAVVRVGAGRKAARSWAAGYAGHLAADLEGDVPLFYPFAHYDFRPSPDLSTILERFFKDRREVAVELALLAWALLTT
jgi:hypothetical protein